MGAKVRKVDGRWCVVTHHEGKRIKRNWPESLRMWKAIPMQKCPANARRKFLVRMGDGVDWKLASSTGRGCRDVAINFDGTAY